MKTFEQYIKESSSQESKHYDMIIKYFIAEPFRFNYVLHNKPGLHMRRKLKYIRPCFGDTYMRVSYTFNSHTYMQSPCEYDYLDRVAGKPRIDNSDSIAKGVNDVILSLPRDTYLTFMAKGVSEIVDYSNTNDTLDLNFKDQKYYFKLYNTYEDTPGSQLDKMLAVAKFIGMSRLDILKVKQKYGILGAEDNLSDQETLDLF